MCTPCPHGKVKHDCMACTGCRHGKLKRRCAACKSEREGQAGSPQVKEEPEIKKEDPEIKQEEPELKPEPFTIRGYFGIGDEDGGD